MQSRDTERVLYKRWVVRDGTSVADVALFVERHIAPHYRSLSSDVLMSLEDPGDGAVLALQRWRSGSAMRRAFSGRAFEVWWKEYEPILQQWDLLVEFHSEWECEVVVAGGVPNWSSY